MEFKGTPGFWQVHGSHVYGAEPGRDLICQVVSENGRLVADRDMIATAPEVVEAGARLLAVFDQQRMTAAERIIVGVSDAGLRTEGNAAIEALRAAISKALQS